MNKEQWRDGTIDVKEYLLNLEEQEKATMGMMVNTRKLIDCVKSGRTYSMDFVRSMNQIQIYSAAYAALLDHAMLLLGAEQ